MTNFGINDNKIFTDEKIFTCHIAVFSSDL